MVPLHRSPRRAPSARLAVGVGLALLTIGGIGAYTHAEVRALRDQQTAISERNRKGSLQLLRIQNNLAALAALMRDMADRVEPYPLAGWRPVFERIRRDLGDAAALERTLAPDVREPAQQARMLGMIDAYWAQVDRMFETARGDEEEARRLIRSSLVPHHRALDGMVSQFLIVNNQVQEGAARANRDIYDRVGREIVLLVGLLLLLTAAGGAWTIASNRRAFDELAEAGEQLRTLSWRMLRLQEDVQRAVSRELHDDFGQVVTAIGTLLGRARRQLAPGSPLGAELDEVRAIAQEALDRIRSRSQWLHPGLLDDFGLARALERCVEQFRRQTGIRTSLTTDGEIDAVGDERAIHVFRIVQEALSNVARHSGANEAWVRVTCTDGALALEVEDRGRGMPAEATAGAGLGLVSMRERAELIGGQLRISRPERGGVAVRILVPDCVPAISPARSEVA